MAIRTRAVSTCPSFLTALSLATLLVVGNPATVTSAEAHALRASAAAVRDRVPASAVTATAQVLVYGGTPAGIVAAVSAARAGVTVLLLEPTSHLGGMMANGLARTDVGDPSTIGGITRSVFTRIQRRQGTASSNFRLEPHIAERVFLDMLRQEGVRVRYNERLVRPGGASVADRRIRSVAMTSGRRFAATVFIDASYEGDLLAEAGVTFRLGRESRTATGEGLAGTRPARRMFRVPAGMTLPPIASGAPGPVGSSDRGIQQSNFRLCLSSDPANRLPFRAPSGYRASDYAAVAAYLRARSARLGLPPRLSWALMINPTLDHKVDVNDGPGVSLALPGRNWSYPTASAAQRRSIQLAHQRWTKGLMYFLRTHPSIHVAIRGGLARYGWCADEWTDNGHFPRQLYIREARRMVGSTLLRQADITTNRTKADVIGVGSYRLDMHDVTRWLGSDGYLYEEGWFSASKKNYAIPYRILTAKRAEMRNLLVPVAASATHVAWGSLRMEPQLMIMGEAAGRAAMLAVRGVKPTMSGWITTGSPIPGQDISVRALQKGLRARGSVLRVGMSLSTAVGSG
jgi:hypothetical protein